MQGQYKPCICRKSGKKAEGEEVFLPLWNTKEDLCPDRSDSPCDLKSPNAFSENRQDYFDYESTNPFTTKFRASNIMPSSR